MGVVSFNRGINDDLWSVCKNIYISYIIHVNIKNKTKIFDYDFASIEIWSWDRWQIHQGCWHWSDTPSSEHQFDWNRAESLCELRALLQWTKMTDEVEITDEGVCYHQLQALVFLLNKLFRYCCLNQMLVSELFIGFRQFRPALSVKYTNDSTLSVK